MTGTKMALVGLISIAIVGPTLAQQSGARSEEQKYEIKLDALRPTQSPELSATVTPGQDLILVPVTYAYTGVLRAEVKERGSFGIVIPMGKPLAANTPVFGVPSSHPTKVGGRADLMWCAAVTFDANAGGENGAERFNVTCLPRQAGSVRFQPLGPNYFPTQVAMNGNLATEPDVDERPVTLKPPLKIELQFAGWTADRCNLRLVLQQPAHYAFGLSPNTNGIEYLERPHLSLDKDGTARFTIFGGEVRLRRGADGKSAIAEVLRPFS